MQGYLRIGDMVAPLSLSKGPRLADGRLVWLGADWLDVGGRRWPVAYAGDGDRLWVHPGGHIHELVWFDPAAFPEAAGDAGAHHHLAAHTPGRSEERRGWKECGSNVVAEGCTLHEKKTPEAKT